MDGRIHVCPLSAVPRRRRRLQRLPSRDLPAGRDRGGDAVADQARPARAPACRRHLRSRMPGYVAPNEEHVDAADRFRARLGRRRARWSSTAGPASAAPPPRRSSSLCALNPDAPEQLIAAAPARGLAHRISQPADDPAGRRRAGARWPPGRGRGGDRPRRCRQRGAALLASRDLSDLHGC